MKTVQLNFRLDPDELLQYKARAASFGMDGSDYFRSIFLSPEVHRPSTQFETTEDLLIRAEAAEKIIMQRELDKQPSPLDLRMLHHLNLILQCLEEMTFILSNSVAPGENHATKLHEVLAILGELQKFMKRLFKWQPREYSAELIDETIPDEIVQFRGI